jgi:hypothetical protein
MKVTKITVEMLEAEKACGQQTALFKEIFPNGIKFTRANWEKAKKADLDVLFCVKFLSPENFAEYNKVLGPAWAKYSKICDSAMAEYNKVDRTAWAEYGKIRYPTLEDYIKVLDSTWADYEKVCVSALFDLLKNQE